MVDTPGEWPWSSYRGTVGRAPAPPWLAQVWFLRHFGRTTREARQPYEQFGQEGQRQASTWHSLRQPIELGDDQFVSQMQRRLPALEALAAVPQVQRFKGYARPLI